MEKYDFCGWATKNNLRCSDGRTIVKDAFKSNDGQTVPLVWNHDHSSPYGVIGHALLRNRDEGVYAYCYLNDTDQGKNTKLLLEHGDISSLSIYANQLKQQGGNVLHGAIREVSVVLAGANPGASIDFVMKHGEFCEDDGIIYTGEDIKLYHSDDKKLFSEKEKKSEKETDNRAGDKESKEGDNVAEEEKSNSNSEETVEDVFNTLNEKQKTVVYALIGQALEDAGVNIDDEDDEDKEKKEEKEEKGNDVKHNVFDNNDYENDGVLSHSEMMTVINDGKRYGSMKDAFIAHGIEDIEYLFPESKSLNTPPEFIKRNTDWVSVVMGGVHHTPFSRIKSMFADITEDEARARGYIKGKLKKEEVFGLLKRTTTPTTVYKKQKMDRDDIIDITDFDVIAWLKGEMRVMLDEELARAILFGDGRPVSSDDKISEMNIRPVWKDEELFTVRTNFTRSTTGTQQEKDDEDARAFIRAAIKSRKEYKGSGNPIMFMNEDMLTNCLLLEDKMGRIIYDTEDKLRTALRVSRIVTVELMENLTRSGDDGKQYKLEGLYLSLNDYNVGADKGGAINMFDDFDIDYNQQKYLIETRCSGALIKPFSAVAIESVSGSTN